MPLEGLRFVFVWLIFCETMLLHTRANVSKSDYFSTRFSLCQWNYFNKFLVTLVSKHNFFTTYFSAIILTHYKLKAEGVVQCLISGTSHLTSDVLRQLLTFAPDDREV